MIRRMILTGLIAVASLGVVAAPVAASSADVITRGSCSGATHWKLKLGPEDGRIEVQFEVDQNRNNRLWRVAMSQNGSVVLRTTRYTRAPSGSFEVRKLLPNRVGADRIVARATNVATGETCRAVAYARF